MATVYFSLPIILLCVGIWFGFYPVCEDNFVFVLWHVCACLFIQLYIERKRIRIDEFLVKPKHLKKYVEVFLKTQYIFFLIASNNICQ